jgi:hypothetical protein
VPDENGGFAPIEPMPQGPAPVPVAPPQPSAPPGYYVPTPPPAFQGQAAPSAYPAQWAYTPLPPRGLSIASMVLGIAGVFFSFTYGLGLFPSIAAVITGHMARKRQPYAKGFSLAGLITGYVGIGVSVLWIAGIIVFFVAIANDPDFSNSSSQ